jgi:hypothetical protein
MAATVEEGEDAARREPQVEAERHIDHDEDDRVEHRAEGRVAQLGASLRRDPHAGAERPLGAHAVRGDEPAEDLVADADQRHLPAVVVERAHLEGGVATDVGACATHELGYLLGIERRVIELHHEVVAARREAEVTEGAAAGDGREVLVSTRMMYSLARCVGTTSEWS